MEKNKELACVQETVFRLYKNVKHLRLKGGLTMEQMADIMKISTEKLKAVEDCKRTRLLCDYHIKYVCDYFHVSASELFRKDLQEE